MNVIDLSLFLVSGLNLFLSLLLFFRNPRNKVNISFAFFVFTGALWPLFIVFFRMSTDYLSAIFWDKAIYISGSLVPAAFLYFAYIFVKKQFPPILYTFINALVPLIFIATLLFSNLWIEDLNFNFDKTTVTLGPIYIGWIIYFAVFMAYGFILLLNKYRQSTGLERTQLGYILLAMLFPIIGAFPFNIILPLFGVYNLIFIGPYFMTIMFTIIGYAVIRHRLFDIRFAFQQFIIYSILTVITFVICISGALSFYYFTGVTLKPGVFIVIAVCSIIIALIYSKLTELARVIARKFLFQSVYDYQKTLKDLSISLSSYLEMSRLADIIIDSLMKTMRLSRVAVLVRDFTDNHYKIQKTIGFDENNGISIVKDNFLTTYLEVHPQIIVLDELKSVIEETPDLNEKDRLEQLYEHMVHIEAALIVPVVNTKRVISLLVLGNKLSGDPYSVQDIDLLHTVASQASIAIENARLYKEVADLNQNLQGKVKEATTELQERNQQLERAYQDLKVLDKLKDDFVSVVSHELRTPMTAIRSYVWMALKRSDIPLSEKLQKYLSRTLVSTERLINLVNDMLNVSRLEAGRVELHPQAFGIWSLVNDVLVDIGPKAKEKEIEINVSKFPIPSVYADSNKVREVLLNLIGNALKFTPENGVIDISFAVNGSMVITSVKDSGVGLSHDDIPRLFQRFGRLDNSYVAAATSGGTGLGLYISKSLVKLMGGEIWATSEGIGTGSTFAFTLPIANQAQVFAPKPEENLTLTQTEIQAQPTIL